MEQDKLYQLYKRVGGQFRDHPTYRDLVDNNMNPHSLGPYQLLLHDKKLSCIEWQTMWEESGEYQIEIYDPNADKEKNMLFETVEEAEEYIKSKE